MLFTTPDSKRYLTLPLLFIVPTMYLTGALIMLMGLPLTWHATAVSVAFVFALTYQQLKNNASIRHGFAISMLALVIFLGLLLLIVFLALQFYDIYYDSQAYHGPAIFYLSEGWNVYHSPQQTPRPLVNTMKVIYSFPKSAWIVSAMIYKAVGNLEGTHTLNIILMVVTGIISGVFFEKTVGYQGARKWIFAALVTFNPIITTQLFSGYIDGVMAASLTIFFFSLIIFVHTRNRLFLLLSLLYLPFLINLKFTGLLFGGILGLTALVYDWARGADWRTLAKLAGLMIAVGAISTLIFGYNPYVTNTIIHHNPVYPAFDFKTGRSIEDKQIVSEFREKSRLAKLLISNFSLSSGQNPKKPVFHMPFTKPWFPASVAGRFSGFGVYFGVVLLLLLPILLLVRPKSAWVLLTGAFISVLATDVGWWARLAPQFWWIPVMILAYGLKNRRIKSWLGFYSAVIILLLAVNAGSMALRTWQNQFLNYRSLVRTLTEKQLDYVQTDERLYLYSLLRLRDLGYQLEKRPGCDHTMQPPLIRGVEICLPADQG